MKEHKHQYKLDRLQPPAAIWFKCDADGHCTRRYRFEVRGLFYQALLGLDNGRWLKRSMMG